MTEHAETTSAHLPQRIDDLDRQVTAAKTKLVLLVERLAAVEADVIAVRQELLDTHEIFNAVADTVADAKAVTGHAASLEAANQTLSSMFGEAFQVVSRFFETAQRLGLVGKDIVEAAPLSLPPPILQEPVGPEPVSLPEPMVAEEPPIVMESADDSFLGSAELADWSTPLDVVDLPPPVDLPPLPDISTPENEETSDIQDVEALLAELSMPIST